MEKSRVVAAWGMGLMLCLGFLGAALVVGDSLLKFKSFERVVTVKGLAEREVAADTAIWPVKFIVAANELDSLYTDLESRSRLITEFLQQSGFNADEITVSSPSVIDKQAQSYGGGSQSPFRYSADQTITVYTRQVEQVIAAKKQLGQLVKSGVVISGAGYEARTEFLFSGLNDIKPAMIEEATRNARQVAEKFAQDSQSQLGKIKTARQGQFSIRDRDSNTPQIKLVRVVSTLEYYLSD